MYNVTKTDHTLLEMTSFANVLSFCRKGLYLLNTPAHREQGRDLRRRYGERGGGERGHNYTLCHCNMIVHVLTVPGLVSARSPGDLLLW